MNKAEYKFEYKRGLDAKDREQLRQFDELNLQMFKQMHAEWIKTFNEKKVLAMENASLQSENFKLSRDLARLKNNKDNKDNKDDKSIKSYEDKSNKSNKGKCKRAKLESNPLESLESLGSLYLPLLFRTSLSNNNIFIYVDNISVSSDSKTIEISGVIMGNKYIAAEDKLLSSYIGKIIIANAPAALKFNTFMEFVTKCKSLFSSSKELESKLDLLRVDDLVLVLNGSDISCNITLRHVITLASQNKDNNLICDLTPQNIESCTSVARDYGSKYDITTIMANVNRMIIDTIEDFKC